MADTVMTVRLVVKEMAQRRGSTPLHAQAVGRCPGSGMHTHLSLFEGDTNAFYDADDPDGLSPWPNGSWPDCCVTRTRSRRDQPVGQLLQAPGLGL